MLSITFPFLTNRNVGTPEMPNLRLALGTSSTSTASTLALPSYSLAKRLTVGSMRLQCGHHEAKNSTISARLCASKALSKDASVTVSFVFIITPCTAFLQYSLFGVPRHRRKKVSSGRNGERDVAEGGFICYNSAVQYG